jgi:hypothetical protein
MNADIPRIMVRFEDTLFHPEAVMHKIKQCAGIQGDLPFKYVVDPTKTGKAATGFGSGTSE